MLAEAFATMSTKKCRLCAKTDVNAIIVNGEENISKILPNRVQTYLEIESTKLANAVRLCGDCVAILNTFQEFYDKVHSAQIAWNESQIAEQEKLANNRLPKPKRREAKLVPFLVRGLDSGRFRGLEWENRTRGLFRLPWPRQGTNRWRPEDSQLFKEWAILKGRYSDKEDFVLWKTCIRTSLHKLPNIREVREFHNFMANPPYKVYCITDFAERYNILTRQVILDHNYTLDSYAEKFKREQIDMESDPTYDNIGEIYINPSVTNEKEKSSIVTPLSLENSEWCVAREETVPSETNLSPWEGFPTEETVAKWIQTLKFSQQTQNSVKTDCLKRPEENDQKDDIIDTASDDNMNTADSSFCSFQRSRKRYERNCKGKECPDCNMKFKSVSGLVKHRERCALMQRVTPKPRRFKRLIFPCGICDKKFSSNETLKTHFNTHFGIRPYTCHMCMDNFYTLAELDKHRLLHSEIINNKPENRQEMFL